MSCLFGEYYQKSCWCRIPGSCPESRNGLIVFGARHSVNGWMRFVVLQLYTGGGFGAKVYVFLLL